MQSNCLQWRKGSNSQGGVFGSWTVGGFYTLWLPNLGRGGNTIGGAFALGPQGGPASNYAVTDDQSNAYTVVLGGNSVGHDQSCYGFYSVGVTKKARKLRVQNNHAATEHNSIIMCVGEFNNITAFDVSKDNVGTGSTAATGGSLTPTQVDDMILQFIMRTTQPGPATYRPASQANITWKLLSSDPLNFGSAAQYGNYNSTSAINPQIDMLDPNGSGDWISVCLAFKTGAAGEDRG